MGYWRWDETAAVDHLSDWLERHRAVRVAAVMLVALLVLGVDFSAPMVALRSALLLGTFITSLVIVLVHDVDTRHHRPDDHRRTRANPTARTPSRARRDRPPPPRTRGDHQRTTGAGRRITADQQSAQARCHAIGCKRLYPVAQFGLDHGGGAVPSNF